MRRAQLVAIMAALHGAARPPVPTATVTLTESRVYACNRFNMHRAWYGAWLSRCWMGLHHVVQGWLAPGFHHVAPEVDPTLWNQSLIAVSAEHVPVNLTAGDKTATEVATAFIAALDAIGVSAAIVGSPYTEDDVECIDVEVQNIDDEITAPIMTESTSARGHRGRQRTNWGGGANTAPSYQALTATLSIHLSMQAAAGRLISVLAIDTSGTRSGNMRLGVANGPAYSTTPGAFSSGVSGIATRDGDFYHYGIPGAQAFTSAQNKWIVVRGGAGDQINLEARTHGSSPPGPGNLTTGERVIIDVTSTTNPSTEIFTAGAYTPAGAPPLTDTRYVAVGVLWEVPDVNGDYPGRAAVQTLIGYQPAFNTGTPSTLAATFLRTVSDSPRYPVPDSCGTFVYFETAIAAYVANGTDFAASIYDMSAVTITAYPIDAVSPLIASFGPMGLAGTGYQRFTPSSPVSLAGVSRIALYNGCGPAGATGTSINYDPPGAATSWQTGYVDDGTGWHDGVELYGINHQYVTGAAGPSDMPVGQTNPTMPANFDGAANDNSAGNGPRIRWLWAKRGYSIVLNAA